MSMSRSMSMSNTADRLRGDRTVRRLLPRRPKPTVEGGTTNAEPAPVAEMPLLLIPIPDTAFVELSPSLAPAAGPAPPIGAFGCRNILRHGVRLSAAPFDPLFPDIGPLGLAPLDKRPVSWSRARFGACSYDGEIRDELVPANCAARDGNKGRVDESSRVGELAEERTCGDEGVMGA